MTTTIFIDGQACQVQAQQTVAAALAQHVPCSQSRVSLSGEVRAPTCGMGICQECRVEINGRPQQLACQTMCSPDMQVRTGKPAVAQTGANDSTIFGINTGTNTGINTGINNTAPQSMRHLHTQIAILGAGPAGQAAAIAAAQAGKQVTLIDDNPLPGGQIWRAAVADPALAPFAALQSWHAVQSLSVQWLGGHKLVWPEHEQRRLLLEPGANQGAHPEQSPITLHYEKLILCNGARELLLPFPGWTLPGVTGLGGLQALVKSGLNVSGKRVVLAGSGPLLLAVAATLQSKGAQVLMMLEQSSRRKLLGFGLGLWATPGKLWQALHLRNALFSIPWHCDSHVLEALPQEYGAGLRAVRLRIGGREEEVACDYLACGFGLQANLRPGLALGCAVKNGALEVDALQACSQPDIYAAGEVCGIGGADKAAVEGRIAGLAASGARDAAGARVLQAQRARWQRFAARLQQAFALRPELKQLAQDDTIVCRCEDVRWQDLQEFADWRSAKLQTRCGMGACQGQICASAMEFCRDWEFDGLRPPLGMVRVGSLVAE